MILYFSGTGNSLYIAKQLAKLTNDRIVSIAELTLSKTYTLDLSPNERIGFVYPVVACAPIDAVTNFIKKVQFNHFNGNYMYSVFNCAGSPEYTSKIMKETAERAGYSISGFYDILMPGNYITQKKHLPKEKVDKYLAECDEKIEAIAKQILLNTSNYKEEKHSFFLSYILHKLAVLEKTEKFIVDDNCVGCGKCAAICSMKAIQMVNKKPVRDQNQCAFCLGCVNVCPTRALRVANKTHGNPQYMNPHYNGKAF